jgi:hypothetical protein
MRSTILLAIIAGICLTVAHGSAQPAGEQKANRLAILIAFPDDDWKEAGGNDLAALTAALRQRGFEPKEILTLSGPATRPLVMGFLREAGKQTAGWAKGSVLLYYTGSGAHARRDDNKKGLERIGWHLPGQAEISPENPCWKDVFEALNLPQSVDLTILPDCCYTNMLVGHLPKNVAGMVLEGDPENWECRAANFNFEVQGKKTQHGVITYFAAQALKEARTLGDLQRQTNKLIDEATKAGIFGPRSKGPPRMATVGEASRVLIP